MMHGLEQLTSLAHKWISADLDKESTSLISAALESSDVDSLRTMFGSRLEFGTAGIRGPLRPGSNGMNRLLVRQTAAGIARHLLASNPSAATKGVVVGRDARHGSQVFAEDTAEVLSGNGIRVFVVDGPAPTPLVAFALRHVECAAAVVITASHNPPQDNGIKVYWGDGAQIVSPTDLAISEQILAASSDGLLIPQGSTPAEVTHLGESDADSELVDAYLSAARELATGPGLLGETPVSVVATSLHGVGGPLFNKTLSACGFGETRQVESQFQPDPEFPTVSFPNPEEPGALDELLELARKEDASVALANDPDADRLAVCATTQAGVWQQLTGDEVGAVLAQHLLSKAFASGQVASELLFATTVVSSRLLSSIAESAGARFFETLTGFKWLCRPALEHPNLTQVLIYEEALGYAIGAHALDKDGITAAVVAADLFNYLAAQDNSVWNVLDDLAREHGAHVTHNGSVRLTGPDADSDWKAALDSTASRLIEDTPNQIAGLAVSSQDQPASDVLRLWLEDNTRVVLRPSGTEPKFKYYCEAIEPVQGAPDAAREVARIRLKEITGEVSQIIQQEPLK